MKPLTEETAKILEPIKLSRYDRLHLSLDADGTHFIAKMYRIINGMKQPPSRIAESEFTQRIPERKKLDGLSTWRFGATDFTTTVISALWPREQIDIDQDAAAMFNYLQLTAKQTEIVAGWQAEWKVNKSVPKHTLELNEDLPLAGYQQTAAHCATYNEGYGLFMEQGTGKTACAIARVCTETRDRRKPTANPKLAAQIEAECESKIAEMRREVDQEVIDAVKRKQAKLESAAQKQAAKQQVHLDYSGTADMLLLRAQEAVREAKQWLGNRMAEILAEVAEVRRAAQEIAERTKREREASYRRTAASRIAALDKPVPSSKPYSVFICCPKNVRMNWQSEFQRFATLPGKITVLRGGKMERIRLLIEAFNTTPEEQFTVVICNYETMSSDIDALKLIQWDLGMLDESHYIKWPDTVRSKKALELRDSCRQRMTLTGTPVCNSPLDLWAQLEFQRKGASGFVSWKAFRKFYGVFETTGEGYEKLVSVQNMPFLKERLARQSFQIGKREALPNLPEMTHDVIEVEMTSEQQAAYDALRTQLAFEIERDMKSKTVTAQHILTRLLRLTQVTSGFVKWDGTMQADGTMTPGIIEYFSPNAKLEELVQQLKEMPKDEKMQIWCTFVPDINAIHERLTAEGIDHVRYYGGTSDADRVDAERRFNEDPICRAWIGNPGAGGTGLNLLGYPIGRPELADTDCTRVVYYSADWSAVKRAQSEARGHRRGTRRPIRVSDLCVPNTIDEEIRRRVFLKRCTAMEMSDVREILARVLDMTI